MCSVLSVSLPSNLSDYEETMLVNLPSKLYLAFQMQGCTLHDLERILPSVCNVTKSEHTDCLCLPYLVEKDETSLTLSVAIAPYTLVSSLLDNLSPVVKYLCFDTHSGGNATVTKPSFPPHFKYSVESLRLCVERDNCIF